MPVGSARTARWRRGWRSGLAAAAAAMLLGGAMVEVAATSASAATVDTTAWYVLVNRNSGKALDVYNFSTADGGAIVQWADGNGQNQQFRLADSDGGYVRLIGRQSGKAVEIQGAATTDGANVVQYADWGGANQQWQLVRIGGTTPTTPTSPPPTGSCNLPSSYRWSSTGSLANPRSGWVSLKDFTYAPYNGRQLVYATTHDFGTSWGS